MVHNFIGGGVLLLHLNAFKMNSTLILMVRDAAYSHVRDGRFPAGSQQTSNDKNPRVDYAASTWNIHLVWPTPAEQPSHGLSPHHFLLGLILGGCNEAAVFSDGGQSTCGWVEMKSW